MERTRTRQLLHGRAPWRLWVDAPTGGPDLPVVWVLDGAALFPLVAETVRRLSVRPDVTGVPPAVIIGLDRDPPDREVRHGDATPWPSSDPDFASHGSGRADALLDLLTGPALEAAAQIAPVDRSRQVLIGHSVMAYFTLYALTARPEAFGAFAAVSPSIWWNEHHLMDGLETLRDAGQRVFIAAGEREEPQSPADEGARRRQARRMVSRARAAAGLASGVLGERAAFHVAADEDHASVLPAVLPRLLRFAFADTPLKENGL